MKVPQLGLAALAFTTSVLALPQPSDSSQSPSTESHLERRDEPSSSSSSSSQSEQPPRPKEYKYFHEPGGDDIMGHYDTRFFSGVVSDEVRVDTLTHMTRAYLNFFREHGLETWIAHGTLLGWWWNGKLLPWDWDVDTQVSGATLAYLGDHFNQTRAKYVSHDKKVKREYLLDINPFSRQRDRGEGLNIIDARWIDTRNGLYIDITGLSELNPESDPGVLECKNHHKYKIRDLYPLRSSTYEGVPARIPFTYDQMLVKEYGPGSLSVTEFQE
ncbi:hypothetical protein FQN54_008996 [Arachnomyces sp. PD_36]|nr:hypothetical protein FQN54_008996 [Arachnomyces sp. PD_36]